MILDSEVWKKEIENQIKLIKSLLENFSKETDNEEDLLLIEFQKFTIYTSIILRKLIQSNRISSELIGKNYSVLKFPKNDKKINILNCYEIEKLYDLSCSKNTSFSLKNLSNNIIHSFHFLPYFGVNKESQCPIGFYFSSDFSKENEIFLITSEQYFKILKEVISDFIVFGEIVDGKIVKQSIKR
jgi:hypothetical protein